MPDRATPYRYAEAVPGAGIAPSVLAVWAFQADVTPPAEHPYTVWPDGCSSLVVVDTGAAPPRLVVVGPRAVAHRPRVAAGMRLWGLRLWPDTTHAVLGVDPRGLRDAVGPCPVALPEWTASLVATLAREREMRAGLRALEEAATPHLLAARPSDATVRRAIQVVVARRGEGRVADVAKAVGLSTRQLQRRFRAGTGLHLREWARIRRLRETLGAHLAAPAETWSHRAAEFGFVDHAHLTREISALTGLTPSSARRQIARTQYGPVVP